MDPRSFSWWWRKGRDFVCSSIRTDYFHKVLETFLAKGLLLVMGFGSSVLVARMLGPEGRGVYGVAFALAGIGIQFLNFGLHSFNTYHVARHPEDASALYSNSVVAVLIGGIVALLGGLLVGEIFHFRLGLSATLWWLAWLQVPAGLAWTFFAGLFLGMNEVRTMNILEVAQKTFLLIFLIVFWIHGHASVTMFFGLNWVSAFFLAFFAAWILRRKKCFFSGWHRALLFSGFHYGMKAYLACFFAFLLIRCDLLMIQMMRGEREAGYYSIAAGLVDYLYLFMTVSAGLLFPRLAAVGSDEKRFRKFLKALGGLGLVFLGLCIFAYGIAGIVVPLFYGEAFRPSIAPFQILIGAVFVLGINNFFSQLFAAEGFPPFAVWVWGIGFVVNILLNWVWIPKLGGIGAAWASVAAYSVVFVIQVYYSSCKWRRKVFIASKTA